MTDDTTQQSADQSPPVARRGRILDLASLESGRRSCAIEIPGVSIDRFLVGGVVREDAYTITYAGTETTSGRSVLLEEYFPVSLAERELDGITVVPQSRRRAKGFRIAMDRFIAEGEMMCGLNGLSVPECLGVFQLNGTAWRVTEAIAAHYISVRDRVEQHGLTLDEGTVRRVLDAVLPVLAKVHSMNALHRAITPDAILLGDNGRVLLTGFGAARYMIAEKSENLRDVLETGFAPFEFLQRRDNQGPCSDLYSLGATLYFSMTGIAPADAFKRFETAQHREPDPLMPALELAGQSHGDVADIVDWMLSLRVQDRPRLAEEIVNRLDHHLPSVLVDRRTGEAIATPIDATIEERSVTKLSAARQARRRKRRALAAAIAAGFVVVAVSLFAFRAVPLSPATDEPNHVSTDPAAPSVSVAEASVYSVLPNQDAAAQPASDSSAEPVPAAELMQLVFKARDAMLAGRLVANNNRSALILLERVLSIDPENTLASEGVNHLLHYFVTELQRAETASDAIGIRVNNRNLRRIRLRHPESRPEKSGGFFTELKPTLRMGSLSETGNQSSRDFAN